MRSHPSSPRAPLALLAGACLLALAGCTGEGEDASANQVVQAQTAPGAASATPSPDAPAAATPAPAPDAAAPAAPAAPQTDASVEAPEPSASVDVAELMEEGPLPDIVIGDPNAPVTIVEYASMTCGHCADFHTNSYPAIKANYIDTGRAKLIIREFPFDPRALGAFMLARCTETDAQRTAMIDVLFDQQDAWARAENASAALFDIARMAGFTQESFTACLNNQELQGQIIATQERGQQEFGVDATPTFFVNGDKYSGTLPADQMAAIIETQL